MSRGAAADVPVPGSLRATVSSAAAAGATFVAAMRLRILSAAVCLAAAAGVLLLVGGGRSARAGPDVPSGRILITLDSEPCCRLVVFDQAGIHAIPTGLLDPSMDQSAWAGRHAVVFTSQLGGDGARHIYRVPAAGGQPRRIRTGLRGVSQEWPSVSTDGTRLAYTEARQDGSFNYGVFIADRDGSDARRVGPPTSPGAQSGWGEPDFMPGRDDVLAVSEVFNRGAGLSSLLILHGRAPCAGCGTGPRELTTPTLDAGYPRYSPDGDTILFSQEFHKSQVGRPGSGPLWLVPSNSSDGPRALTHHPRGTWSYEGDWSPDGSQIVYLYFRPGWNHNQIRIVNADGSGDHALWTAPAGTYAAVPDWGPS
jgi:hypothetical protein